MADHSQEIERTDEEGRKASGGFGENGENCDFTSSAKPFGISCLASAILKVIGSHSNIELRNVSLARNNLDFVAATVMPASLAISFMEAFDR